MTQPFVLRDYFIQYSLAINGKAGINRNNFLYGMIESFERMNHEIHKPLNESIYEDKDKREIFLCSWNMLTLDIILCRKRDIHILKKSVNVENIKIETTMDLWNVFEKATNLKKNFFDKELERQIRENLKFTDSESIRKNLKKGNISIVSLLNAILTAMQPFSQMMCDLLKMFENASAKQRDCNLQICMGFEDENNNWGFSLEEFRQDKEKTVQTCRTVEAQIPRDLWRLNEIYADSINCNNCNNNISYNCIKFNCNTCKTDKPQNCTILKFTDQNDIAQWQHEYCQNEKLPDFVPQRPSMGIPNLDKWTAKCWNIFEIVVAGCRHAYDDKEDQYKTILEEGFRNDGNEFWKADQKSWTSEFLHTITCVANIFQNVLSKKEAEEVAERLVNDLKNYFKDAKEDKIDILQTAIANLTEILNLPFWKRRHELYAAWVSTQIVEALQDRDVEFQVIDNKLSFSQRDSHIATCTGLCPPLEIWSELRTNAKKLIGNGRKKVIQLDYTLAVPSATEQDNTAVVIECKQYEKPNIKNFRDAVIDYANGKPQAGIMLVGYGNIPNKMYEKIEEQIKSRVVDFSFMRPGSVAAKEFKEKLRELVLGHYSKKAKENKNYLHP